MIHDCPLCQKEEIPTYRSLCGKCYPVVPWELRSDFMRAWRTRAIDQPGFQEALVDLLSWWLEYRAMPKEPAKGVEEL